MTEAAAWILVTLFSGTNTPEQFGYKGYPTEEACQSELRQITGDLATLPFEQGNVVMTCVETHGRSPDVLAMHIAAKMKISR